MRIRRGDADAIARGIELLGAEPSETQDQLSIIRAFGTYSAPAAVPPLIAIASGRSKYADAALAALQIYDSPKIASSLITNFPDLPEERRPTVINLLGSRQDWAISLLESHVFPGAHMDPDLVARLRRHPSERLQTLLDRHFPETPRSSDPQAEIESVSKILEAGRGNPYLGETHYQARCAACHTLFFKGGKVGPGLTAYQRDDLETLLPSVIDPDAEIREGYENFLVKIRDGRLLSGFLAENGANTITLRSFDGSDSIIPRSEIEELKPTGHSLMPAGLLDDLSDQELRDLFAYIRISQPISK